MGGRFAAVDPEGETLSYEITTEPGKGVVEVGENGRFVYTPAENKKGKDYFGYRAVDASGNRSEEATVIITILKEQVMMSVSTSDNTAAYLFQAPDLVQTFAAFGLPDFVLTSITDIVNGFFDLTWKSGVQMLLLLSAINNIPQSFYEAAVLDGAGAWVKFWKITFPAITPSLLVVIIYTIIDSFLDYDNLVMSMIRNYYQNNNYTYSATIGVIYFVCILALVGLVSLIMRKLVVYMYQ